ncbi:MAG TPA: hypothetical protein PK231_05740 [Acidocella sp.]|nr:hypothetical protein [Acidocella sp.]
MIVLTLAVCLAGTKQCREIVIPAPNERAGFMGCMVAAQPSAATWISEHPQYVLRGWRCGPEQRGA